MHSELEAARHLFDVPSLPLLYPAVLAGNQPATVWHNGTSGFLWDLSYKRYLSGTVSEDVCTILRASIEEWLGKGNRIAVVVPLTSEWRDEMPQVLQGYRISNEAMNVYRSTGSGSIEDDLDERYVVAPIDRVLIENSVAIREEVVHMWGHEDAFLQNGFGWAAILSEDESTEEVVGWCTAEYLSEDKVGLGVETVPDHRRKGIASLLTNRCVYQGRELGLEVFWECNSLNEPSIGVARKVGFEQVGSYPIVVVEPMEDPSREPAPADLESDVVGGE